MRCCLSRLRHDLFFIVSFFLFLFSWCLSGNAIADDYTGYWNLDEGTGTNALDSSTNHTDAILVEENGVLATWVPGIKGNALKFNGTNSYVSIPASSAFTNTFHYGIPWSIEMWAKPAGVTDGVIRLFDKPYTSHSSPYYQILFGIQTDLGSGETNRDYAIATYTAGTGLSGVSAGTNSAVVGEWTHLVVTCSPHQGIYKIYKNGVLAGQKLYGAAVAYNSFASGAALARFLNAAAGRFDGTIDEVKIYNRMLSDQEVRSHYMSAFRITLFTVH